MALSKLIKLTKLNMADRIYKSRLYGQVKYVYLHTPPQPQPLEREHLHTPPEREEEDPIQLEIIIVEPITETKQDEETTHDQIREDIKNDI